jgi:hypothetical protein
MSFGKPPRTGLILNGKFDPAAIGTALKAQGFVQSALDSLMLWCGPKGCASGLQQDLAAITPANPFGGQLGRKQPIAVQPDYVFSSADYSVVQGIAGAIHKKQPSLAEAKEYLAAVEAFTASGTLIQAYFVNVQLISKVEIPKRPGMDRVATAMAKDFAPIPQYSLVALAHIVEGNEQRAVVALVYDRAADAKTAAEILPKRITAYQSLVSGRPFVEIVRERGGSIDTPQIYSSTATGKSVLTITFRGPIEPETPVDGRFRVSGLLYVLLMQSIAYRDIGWLAVDVAFR